MVSLQQAFTLIREKWPATGTERVDLENCNGRILAEDLYAKVSAPPFDASAMDGFAVRFSDVRTEGSVLNILGEVPAGAPNEFSLKTGDAVRVFTGSPMPQGSDHVLIQEHARTKAGQATVTMAQKEARHIREAGGDFHRGDRVLAKGTRLNHTHIGLAAAANHSALCVHSQLSVAILAAGSELCPPGEKLAPGQVIESNSRALALLLETHGARVKRLPIASDRAEDIKSRFLEASEADVLLTVGGASVGKYDLVRSVFSELGGECSFERIAVRPGKPTWFGTLGRQRVIGLPGNPTAAIVIASLLIKPRLKFEDQLQMVEAFLATDLSANGPRETYTRARLWFEAGVLRVSSLEDQDTSRTRVLTSTNGLLWRSEHAPPKYAGDKAQVVLLADIDLARPDMREN